MATADFEVVLCEYRHADVVGMRRIGGHMFVLAMEAERNVIRNVRRNLMHGCDCVLEVCIPPLSKVSVERLLTKALTDEEHKRVHVLGTGEVTVELLRSFSGGKEVDSGLFMLIREVNSEETRVSSDLIRVDSQTFSVTAQDTIQSQEGGEIR